MAFLEQFTADEQTLLVALPYRAGLWISACDSSGGAEADFEELHKLEEILEKMESADFGSLFVREVMAATMSRQREWKKWAETLDELPGECTRASALVIGRLPQKDGQAYKAIIMNVATQVAKAFREKRENESALSDFAMNIKTIIESFLAKLTGGEPSRAMNVSAAEKEALLRLEQALNSK